MRRIVVRTRAGLMQITGLESDLGGCPGVIAYGEKWSQAKLIRVEKTYALYRELPPKVDDGA